LAKAVRLLRAVAAAVFHVAPANVGLATEVLVVVCADATARSSDVKTAVDVKEVFMFTPMLNAFIDPLEIPTSPVKRQACGQELPYETFFLPAHRTVKKNYSQPNRSPESRYVIGLVAYEIPAPLYDFGTQAGDFPGWANEITGWLYDFGTCAYDFPELANEFPALAYDFATRVYDFPELANEIAGLTYDFGRPTYDFGTQFCDFPLLADEIAG